MAEAERPELVKRLQATERDGPLLMFSLTGGGCRPTQESWHGSTEGRTSAPTRRVRRAL